MLKILIPAGLILFLFSGCATKETVIYPPCVLITKAEVPKARKIRVYKADEALVRAYINEFRFKLNMQNDKIERANSVCKKWRKSVE